MEFHGGVGRDIKGDTNSRGSAWNAYQKCFMLGKYVELGKARNVLWSAAWTMAQHNYCVKQITDQSKHFVSLNIILLSIDVECD